MAQRDVAVVVEAGGPAGRDEAGGIVFLDDAGAGMRRRERAAVDDAGIEPTALRPDCGASCGEFAVSSWLHARNRSLAVSCTAVWGASISTMAHPPSGSLPTAADPSRTLL